MTVAKYMPTRWEIVARFRDGSVLPLGISARYTKRALLSAASANGKAIGAHMTDAELDQEWSYRRGSLNLGNGACVIAFGSTERQVVSTVFHNHPKETA